MKRLSIDDIVTLVSKHSGYTKTATRDLLTSYSKVVRNLLLKGQPVKMAEIGTFVLKDRKPTPARDMFVPMTGETVHIEAKPAHQVPHFKFYQSFKDEVKEKTEGALY